ncbi:hypothetical protein JW826_03985 [Candidatus Woesearchaeota archaeon]|nr:hypothetical protein [Candidatus Woesearchaeota archaeon]
MKYKYPRLTLLALSFLIVYIIFTASDFTDFRAWIESLGLLGVFISGILYVYGFTAAIGAASLLVLSKEVPFLLAAVVAGIGALLGDLVIFKLIRHEFMTEIGHLANEPIVIHSRAFLERTLHAHIKTFLPQAIGVFMIASPLPDEIGVSLLAASRNISQYAFSIISFTLNTLGIMMVLYVGRMIF